MYIYSYSYICLCIYIHKNKSPQVSRILFSILAILNNVVVWMDSTRPLISKSSSPFINPLVTKPKAGRMLVGFAPSSLCVWNRMPW